MTSKLDQATLNLSADSKGYRLDRTFSFGDGSQVSFSVPVKDGMHKSVVEIHQETIAQVIELLRSTLPQSSDQPASQT
ncbi:hypothetical protein H3V53_13920 [Paraburkholderia bengalensis]|uniref:Uncharacterized protein n=1 Tax=Paraburkholderia bengalensis TaxID=2747562 RepID=A0ABU8IRL4_9BURK